MNQPSFPRDWRMACVHAWWFFRRCPLTKACAYNAHYGYQTWWRGVVIGPFAIGVIWRTKEHE